jgi:hypothetical protein
MTVTARLGAVLLATLGLLVAGPQATSATTISGITTAYFESGRVVAGTQITLSECTAGLPVASATSDMTGFYSLSIPAGTYVMAVTPPAAGLFASPAEQPLSVTADQTRNLVLAPHGDPPFYSPAIDRISALRISSAVLVAATEGLSAVSAGSCKTGTVVTYSGSRPATTTFMVQRSLPGRRAGATCVRLTKPTKNHAQCTRYTDVGSFTHDDVIGMNRFRFTGRVNGRKLAPGAYRLRAVPHNAVGNGPAAYQSFRVTKY